MLSARSQEGFVLNSIGQTILAQLQLVELERLRRLHSPAFAASVNAVKVFQQRRFVKTHGDLLGSARYGPATLFFLTELYGPADFSRRDAQFARVVPTMVRLFPKSVSETVALLSQLHAMTEVLDNALAVHANSTRLSAASYVEAWQATGRNVERRQQIGLVLSVARSLQRLTDKPLLHASLRMMRGPAAAAGLGELQLFLEHGFETFRQMRGASEFLRVVEQREQDLMYRLFDTNLAVPGPVLQHDLSTWLP